MKDSARLLGIDLGTSGLKAAIFDRSGTILSQAYRESHCVDLEGPRKEQRPEEWWQNLGAVVQECLASSGVKSAEIAGVGICGFHHCPVFLDDHGQAVRPVILTHDGRLPASREELAQSGILDKIETQTRSMVSAGHFPPIFHYVRTHDPESLSRTRWILSAKDYLRFRLTDQIGAEICDATGTNLIAPGAESWSNELCALLSVNPQWLPAIGAPAAIAGAVTAEAARFTGLQEGTPVVYGGGDSHCALLGLGCSEEGDTGLLLGTNSTLRTVFGKFVSHPQNKVWVQHHVVGHAYTVSASSMAGASVVQWFRERFWDGTDDDAQLEAAVESVPAGSEGLMFLPYIYGERSPFYDPAASGAFVGIRHGHRREHFLRSVLEGIALNIANCNELLVECAATCGASLNPPRLAGGGSRLAAWHQIVADCLNQPIHVMSVREAGTLGAAMLAGIGVGVFPDYRAAVNSAVRESGVIQPNAGNSALYRQLRGQLNDYRRRLT